MNIPEAIEVNKFIQFDAKLEGRKQAIQLGIEALERELQLRHWQRLNKYAVNKLPSETE